MLADEQSSPIPNFSRLAEIMQHFEEVPFEQFKKDLDMWFKIGCEEKTAVDSIFRQSGGGEFPEQLKSLIQQIYLTAERIMQVDQ